MRGEADFNKGLLLHRRGDTAGARAAYVTAVAAHPDHAMAHLHLAMLAKEEVCVRACMLGYACLWAGLPADRREWKRKELATGRGRG